MKKLLMLIFLLTTTFLAQAQDILIKRSGEKLPVKVLEITPELVKFIPFNNQDGPVISFYKRDVAEIKYENGQVEKFYFSPKEIRAAALESKPLRKNALALNILPIIATSFNVFYDRHLEGNRNIALSLGVGFYKHQEDFFFPANNQFALTGAAKFYIAASDFYLSPYLKYRHVSRTQYVYHNQGSYTTTTDLNWNQFGGGGAFGVRHVFKSGFLVDSFLGLGGYAIEQINIQPEEYFFKPSGVDMRLGVALGYAF